MIKVSKFGGSSLSDAQQFKKVRAIIETDPKRKIVVVSASGKRNKEDNKITDLLYLCYAHLKYSVSCDAIWSMIEERYISIKQDLGLSFPIEQELSKLKDQLHKGMNEDYLVSRGEYLCALLLAEYLDYTFVDAADVILFDYSGKIDFEKSKQALEAILKRHDRLVIPGFYGSLPDGEIRTLTRGGSDITGSIIAKNVEASLYENWTDVSGILVADPSIVKKPKQIQSITYEELRELSYMGANVLHEEAIFPVMEANIPIHIRNTNAPEEQGTMIIEEENHTDSIVTGIAGKKDFSVITIYKKHLSDEVGIIRKALSVIEKYHINVEHIPSGIDSFSIVVPSHEIKHCKYDVVVDIREATACNTVKVIDEIALIATVGRHMVDRPGISGRLFTALGKEEINIRMIAQGSDEITIIIGVENQDFEKAINAIYHEFVE